MSKKFFCILLVIALAFSSVGVYADTGNEPQSIVIPIEPQAIIVPDDGGGAITAPDGGLWQLYSLTNNNLFQIYDTIEYVPQDIVYLKLCDVISETDKGIITSLFQDGSIGATQAIFAKYFPAATVTTVIMPYFLGIYAVYDVGQTLLDLNFRSMVTQAASQGKGIIVELGHYGPAAGLYQGVPFKSAKVWSNYPNLQTPLYHIGSFTHY